MRRYTYITKTNAITGTSTIQRYRSRDGITRTTDTTVTADDNDYQYCLEHSPESITTEDITQQYYDQRMIEVKQQRRDRFHNEVDDLTAELARRREIKTITVEKEQTIVSEIARLSDEILQSLPYPEIPNN
ncbi:MAG: hypothetical protein PF448_13160 [Bacteroidales bacterium]|jgi:hypothetical protein|nr:hypothetical protein [Bacteroidales bacterium]